MWGGRKQSALLPLCACVLVLGTELARDPDPASAGSPAHRGSQRVSHTTSFGFLLIRPSVTFPLKRSVLKTPSHCSSKLFKAHELSCHTLNHFSYRKVQLQAPAKRLTFTIAIKKKKVIKLSHPKMSNFIARLCQSLRDPSADPWGISPLCPPQALVLKLQGHSRNWSEGEPFSGQVLWKGLLPSPAAAWMCMACQGFPACASCSS